MEIAHMIEEGHHVRDLARETILGLDDQVNLTLDAEEDKRILQSISPLR